MLRLFSFCVVITVALLSGTIWSQEQSDGKQPSLLGIWTQIYDEYDRDVTYLMWMRAQDRLAQTAPIRSGPGASVPYALSLWKFNDKTIESGFDRPGEKLVPSWAYDLHPDGKQDALDLVPLNDKGEKIEKHRVPCIYLLKDDILLICRPAFSLPGQQEKKQRSFVLRSLPAPVKPKRR